MHFTFTFTLQTPPLSSSLMLVIYLQLSALSALLALFPRFKPNCGGIGEASPWLQEEPTEIRLALVFRLT